MEEDIVYCVSGIDLNKKICYLGKTYNRTPEWFITLAGALLTRVKPKINLENKTITIGCYYGMNPEEIFDIPEFLTNVEVKRVKAY